MSVIGEEVEAAGGVGCGEVVEEQPAEQTREHAHRQEAARPARHPARAVERDAVAGHDYMDARMMGERRAPSVKHGGDADAGAYSSASREPWYDGQCPLAPPAETGVKELR